MQRHDSERELLETLAASFYRRTKFAAAAFAILGFVVGAVLVPLIFSKAKWDLRALVAAPLAPLAVAGMYAATVFASSVFFAPGGYFETKIGASILRSLQLGSVGSLRAFAIVLLTLCLLMFFVAISQVAVWAGLVQGPLE